MFILSHHIISLRRCKLSYPQPATRLKARRRSRHGGASWRSDPEPAVRAARLRLAPELRLLLPSLLHRRRLVLVVARRPAGGETRRRHGEVTQRRRQRQDVQPAGGVDAGDAELREQSDGGGAAERRRRAGGVRRGQPATHARVQLGRQQRA